MSFRSFDVDKVINRFCIYIEHSVFYSLRWIFDFQFWVKKKNVRRIFFWKEWPNKFWLQQLLWLWWVSTRYVLLIQQCRKPNQQSSEWNEKEKWWSQLNWVQCCNVSEVIICPPIEIYSSCIYCAHEARLYVDIFFFVVNFTFPAVYQLICISFVSGIRLINIQYWTCMTCVKSGDTIYIYRNSHSPASILFQKTEKLSLPKKKSNQVCKLLISESVKSEYRWDVLVLIFEFVVNCAKKNTLLLKSIINTKCENILHSQKYYARRYHLWICTKTY